MSGPFYYYRPRAHVVLPVQFTALPILGTVPYSIRPTVVCYQLQAYTPVPLSSFFHQGPGPVKESASAEDKTARYDSLHRLHDNNLPLYTRLWDVIRTKLSEAGFLKERIVVDGTAVPIAYSGATEKEKNAVIRLVELLDPYLKEQLGPVVYWDLLLDGHIHDMACLLYHQCGLATIEWYLARESQGKPAAPPGKE